MTEKDFLAVLARDVLDGTVVTMDTQLEDVEAWDSLATVEFLGLADTSFGKAVSPIDVKLAETVQNLYDLLQ